MEVKNINGRKLSIKTIYGSLKTIYTRHIEVKEYEMNIGSSVIMPVN